MRRLLFLAALLAALAAALVAAALGTSSSHREAPLTALDPTGDDTDVYAFTARDVPGSLTIVSNWIPFEDPAGGPNFYRFDDRARYYINVDNTGDGVYDIRYRFRFRTKVENPKSFLYALPGVSSIDDPKLNIKQFYNVHRYTYENGKLTSRALIGRRLPVAPNNVGPKTIPDYNAVANQAIKSLPQGAKVFAGQREDPFYVDLGATFDAINLRVGTGASGGGKDDLAGYAVHSIVLQVPEAHVTRTGKQVHAAHDRDAVVGVWASTERRRLQVTGVGADDGKANASRRRSNGRKRNPWIQVSRLANPLVNEVVIPLGFKDRFNATQPSDDAANFGRFVVEPELAKLLNILFPGLNVPETDRTDIVQAVLQGIPELNQITKDPPPTDTLKINLGTPPAEKGKENRFGVIGGDLAGYPNGRRLGDDVVDIALRVVGGVLKGNPLPLGDGVDQNDVPFLDSFPYVGPPQSGFDSELKRLEPTHPPTSAVNPK